MNHVVFLAGVNNYDTFLGLLSQAKGLYILCASAFLEKNPHVSRKAEEMEHQFIDIVDWKTIRKSIVYVCFPVLHMGVHLHECSGDDSKSLNKTLATLKANGNKICYVPEDIYLTDFAVQLSKMSDIFCVSNADACRQAHLNGVESTFPFSDARIQEVNYAYFASTKKVGVILAEKWPFESWIPTVKKIDYMVREHGYEVEYRVIKAGTQRKIEELSGIYCTVGKDMPLLNFLQDKEYVISVNTLSSYVKTSSLGRPSLLYVDFPKEIVETYANRNQLLPVIPEDQWSKIDLVDAYCKWRKTLYTDMPLSIETVENFL